MKMSLSLLFTLSVSLALFSACSTSRAIPNSRVGLFSKWSNKSKDPFRKPSTQSELDREREEATASSKPEFSKFAWMWPLEKVSVSSKFGRRGRKFHEGIDLRARDGTPVYAARPGTVFYAGRKIKGYGNMVVLSHEDGYFTIYAHNSKLKVKQGEIIQQGQLISYSGHSGRVHGPHLHFEVRRGTVALDPEKIFSSEGRSIASRAP